MAQRVDPALDVLNRALHGDHGALSFLDRTSSIYVLDATDPSKPKTYGGWNFIHQAMNEIERNEAEHIRNGTASGLTGHVQMLATIAQRVARRSPAMDRSLVATCIANASQYHASEVEAQALIDLNSEIREIVMGRIAAMAFDFSFHSQQRAPKSAFSDPVAMEKLCSVLAANAVSSGPKAVNHFMNEWIIPCVSSLPPFAVACVTYHLGIESLSKTAAAGTRAMLQSLSQLVVGIVIGPVMMEAIGETSESPDHAWNCRVAALSLRALERWCSATELSLPQIKHICSKGQVNFVAVISDALYSDSGIVVEAMAELLDVLIQESKDGKVSTQRMNQARYVVEIDADAFRSISAEDLYRIEVKEMNEALSELVAAVGLQRFRFAERQSNGDHGICRNLTRIASTVGSASLDGLMSGEIQGEGSGLLELLMKAGAHPFVHISSIAIEVLSKLMPLDPSFPRRMLPLLQHRAIIPYVLVGTAPSLAASLSSGVDFNEFENFRQNILFEALVVCYEQNPTYYMDSCTSAVEEFCASSATVEVSFQLEAALFCMTAVALTVNGPSKGASMGEPKHSPQLARCTKALAAKPAFLPANPLALAQLNRFIGVYGSWFTTSATQQDLDVAFELSVSTINMSGTAFSAEEPASKMLEEMAVSPFSEAAKAVRILLNRSSSNFSAQGTLTSLGRAWETTFVAANRRIMTVEDREEICKGLCSVISCMPEAQREKPYHAFALPSVSCLQTMTSLADESRTAGDGKLAVVLQRLADEVRLLSTMVKSFVALVQKDNNEMQIERQNGSSSSSSTSSRIAPSISLLNKLWPCLTHIATNYATNRQVSESLGYFLISCVPLQLDNDESLGLTKELFKLASSMIPSDPSKRAPLLAIMEFLERVVDLHGAEVEAAARRAVSTQNSNTPTVDASLEAGRMLEDLLLASIQNIRSSLGTAWTRDMEQGQGQRPFESKAESSPPLQEKPSSTDVLAAIFTVLSACAKSCPTFLVYLPASPGGDRDNDRLVARAVESAVAGLPEGLDAEVVRPAILFLKSVMELMAMTESRLKEVVESIVSRVRASIVAILLAGSCGSLHPTLLDPAATLLYTILRCSSTEEAQSYYEAGLQQPQFQLGDEARSASGQFLARCCTGDASSVSLMDFTEALWELHQLCENGSVASESDQVVAFTNKLKSS